MIKKISAITLILAITGCSSVTNEPVTLMPYKYSVDASKNDLYFAAVDCSLENITAPSTNGEFFDYQDKESGRLAVAFETSYMLSGFSQTPLKTTMSIKVKENDLTIRFNSLQQYFDSIGWTSVNKRKDGETSDAELKIQEFANKISTCIKNRA
ncbi:hypothetical protein [Pseudoalteromonas 'SMAR']|uniref:hypothetical protein n=1 Tax=Pseudoalteromonas 'SMAR' TaxID=3416908 RepID=UPI003AF2D10E